MHNKNTCCFIGHRKITDTPLFREHLRATIETLINSYNVDTFLFGSKSEFNSLCYELICESKQKHPHIKRIYVRAEFPYIDDDYLSYLLEYYEGTYFPANLLHAGKAVYLERNREMIDKSNFCVLYCHQACKSAPTKSGTAAALAYALQKGRTVFLFPQPSL